MYLNVRKVSFVLATALGVLLISLPLRSQLNTGRISGAITDQTGGAIAGATVSVVDTARGQTRTLTADSSGLYAAPNLLPGIYTLRVEFMGFQTVERQNVQVGAGSDVRVDVTMQPGQQTQTVTVTESLPVVNTTNAQTGGTLQNNQIADLPFNGRNYRWMVEYVPGIMTQPGEGTASSMTNGGGSDWVNFMVDGLYDQSPYSKQSSVGGAGEAGDTTILPLDAVQEIAIVQNPKAEYGWDPGTTINVALKSGTNTIHGSAFAFGRDTDFDAKNNFAAVRAPTAYEQFGGSFGGPIKKDKLFFFAGEESIRLNVTSDFLLNNNVPRQSNGVASASLGIPAAIAGDNAAGVPLSQLSLNMLGCGSAASYAGETTTAAVPSCSLNTIGAGAGSLYSDSPDCTFATATSTSASCSFPQYGGSNNALGKIDYHINDHHSFNGSYFFGQYHEFAAASTSITQPYWEEVLGVRSQMVRGVEIWTPNSNWLNELRAGWDHDSRPIVAADCSANGSTNDPLGLTSQAGQDGSPNYLTAYGLQTGTGICGNPTIKLSKLATLGFGNNRDNFESDFQGTDSVSYTRGTHQFKFGVDARFQSFNGVKVQDSQRGTVTFGGAGAAAFTNATALEDFIAGDPSSETIKLGTPIRTIRWDLLALFVQDDWRILQRLTLNLGLRWEDETPAKDDNGQLATFDPANPSGMIQNNQLWGNQSDFSPHFGLAWDVTGKGTTTVRSGIGFAYAVPQLMDNITSQFEDQSGLPTAATLLYGNGTAEQTYGVNTVGNITNMLIAPAAIASGGVITGHLPWAANSNIFNASQFQCGDGLPVAGGSGVNPPTCTGYGAASNYRLPQMITWNLNVERAFTNNFSLDVGYVGSHTSDISTIMDLNEPNQSPLPGQVAVANNASNELERRPYFENCTAAQVGTGGLGLNPSECFPWFSQILSLQDVGSANYAGFQAYLNQRPTHGFTYTIGYTLGHAIGIQDGVGTGTNFVLNDNSPKSEYGNMNLDTLHHFSFTGTYEIPGRKSPGQMLEGWAINSTVNILSPLPLNADDTTDDFSATGENIDRWDLYGNAKPFNQLIGGAGLIPCFGVAGSAFAKQANCTTVAAGAANTDVGTAAYVANMPAACIAGAETLPNSPAGVTPLSTTSLTTSNGYNGLAQLAEIGCYMVNGSAMLPPALGTYGNMQRNGLRGKGFSTWNASVTKDWKIRERLNVQFRAEGFNILNRTMYAGVGLNLGAPNTFGEATSTPDVAKSNPVVGSGGPREVQLGLKLSF